MATITIDITVPDAAIPLIKEAWPSSTNAELKAKLTDEFLMYIVLRLKERRRTQSMDAAKVLADSEVNDVFAGA